MNKEISRNPYLTEEEVGKVYTSLSFDDKLKQGQELALNKIGRFVNVSDISTYLQKKIGNVDARPATYLNFIWQEIDHRSEFLRFIVNKRIYKEHGFKLPDDMVEYINKAYQSVSKSAPRIAFLSYLSPIFIDDSRCFTEETIKDLKIKVFENEVALMELNESFENASESKIVLEGINPWMGHLGGISTRDNSGNLDGVRESFDTSLSRVQGLVSFAGVKKNVPIACTSHLVAKTTGRWSYLEKWLPYIDKLDKSRDVHELMWSSNNTGSFSNTIGMVFNFPRYSRALNDLNSLEDWKSFFNVIDEFLNRGFFELPKNYQMSLNEQLSIFNSYLERQLAPLLVDYREVDETKLFSSLDKINNALPKLNEEQMFDSMILFYFSLFLEGESYLVSSSDSLFFNSFGVDDKELIFKSRLSALDSTIVFHAGGWKKMVDEAIKKGDSFNIKMLWSLSGLLNEWGRGELFEELSGSENLLIQENKDKFFNKEEFFYYLNKDKFFNKEEFFYYFSNMKGTFSSFGIQDDKTMLLLKAKMGKDTWSSEFNNNERMTQFDFLRNNSLHRYSSIDDVNVTEIRLKPLEFGFKKWIDIQAKEIRDLKRDSVEMSRRFPDGTPAEKKQQENKWMSQKVLGFLNEKLKQADEWKEKYGSLVDLNEKFVDDDVLMLKVLSSSISVSGSSFYSNSFNDFIIDEIDDSVDRRIIDSSKVHVNDLLADKTKYFGDDKKKLPKDFKTFSSYWSENDFIEMISENFVEHKSNESLFLFEEAALRYPEGNFYGVSFSKLQEYYKNLYSGELTSEQKKELKKNPTVNVLLNFLGGKASDFEKSLKFLKGLEDWKFSKCTPFELFSRSCSCPESHRFSGGIWYKKMEKMINWMSTYSLHPMDGIEKTEDPSLSKKRIFYLSMRLMNKLLGDHDSPTESRKKMNVTSSLYFKNIGMNWLKLEDLFDGIDTWQALLNTVMSNTEQFMNNKLILSGSGIRKINENTLQEKMVLASTIFRTMASFNEWVEYHMLRDKDFAAKMGTLLFENFMSGTKNLGNYFVDLTHSGNNKFDMAWMTPWLLTVMENKDVLFFDFYKENTLENKKEFLEKIKKFIEICGDNKFLFENMNRNLFGDKNGEKLKLLLVAACQDLENALLAREQGDNLSLINAEKKKGLRF